MSEAAPIWHCNVAEFNGDMGGAPLNNLTVGSKFELDCQGEIAVVWKAEVPATLTFAKPEEEKYSLVILKVVKQEARSATYIVTSYKPGEFSPEYIRIMTGDQGFEANGLHWQVNSVIPKNQPPPQPFPSFGPYLMNMPIWLWGFVLGGAIILALIGWRIVRRVRQRRKVQQMLKEHASALPAHTQFHKELRQIKKAITAQIFIDETSRKLDTEFRLYLLRTFQIPALDWSDAEIMKDLKKKNYSLYESEAKRVSKVLRELKQLRTAGQAKVQDLEQMFVLTRDTVDRVEKVKEVLK